MMKSQKQYPLEQSPLYCLKRKSKLAALLGISLKQLTALYPDDMYFNFATQKKDGTKREISAPDRDLKATQKRLLSLLQKIETPDWLISGKKGKSYIDNARFHLGTNNVLTIDIRNFYNNCRHKYIYRLFLQVFRTSPDVACLLCKITTRLWILPTGAPTSQLIAFLTYRDTFETINLIANKYGCRFSLYVDDMTFSSEKAIQIPLLLTEVSHALHIVGHRIKYSKIINFRNGRAKLITGAVIDKDNRIRVPNNLRKLIMDDLRKLKADNLSNQERKALRNSIIGRINAARLIEHGIFPEVYKYVRNLVLDE